MGKKKGPAKTLSPTIKPVAKAIVKAGLSLYDAAEERVVEARERLLNLVSEVRKDMNGGVTRKPNSKKASSHRRPKK
jgi:hypothetical protein